MVCWCLRNGDMSYCGSDDDSDDKESVVKMLIRLDVNSVWRI